MIINPKFSNENELQNAEAKLKQYGEEYNRLQHEYYIDEIEELKNKSIISKHTNHHETSQYIILITLSHLLLLNSFVKKMELHIMHLILIDFVS